MVLPQHLREELVTSRATSWWNGPPTASCSGRFEARRLSDDGLPILDLLNTLI